MKRFLALLILLTLPLYALASGGGEIALVTDIGPALDGGFNEAVWKGIQDYAEASGISHSYYQPTENIDPRMVERIEIAIAAGAKVVVLPGFLFEWVILEVQDAYPDTIFILLDAQPAGELGPNTYSILSNQAEAGFLAGYASVKEGYTKLGFLGSRAVPAIRRTGYGFIQGVDAAAKEIGVTPEIKYWYADDFEPSDDIKTKMNAWYTDGTQVVLTSGGGVFLSALDAAEASGTGKLIIEEIYSFPESPALLTVAAANPFGSIVQTLAAIYGNEGKLPENMQGSVDILGASVDGVGLNTVGGSWRFANFSLADYEALYLRLKGGGITVSTDASSPPEVEATTVDYQN